MRLIAIIILGIVTGLWCVFSPGTLCIGILGFGLVYLFGLHLKDLKERKLFLIFCLLALLMRFTLSLFNYYLSCFKGIGVDFIPDARAYSTSGQYIAEVINGKGFGIENNEVPWLHYLRDTYAGLMPESGYRVDAFAKHIGFVYSLFGYDPLVIKFINSILSVFSGVLLFMLAKKMFSVRIANIVLILVIFWPSLFLWSITGLKDTLLIFLVTLSIYIYIEHIRNNIGILEYSILMLGLLTSSYVIFFVLLAFGILFRIYKNHSFQCFVNKDIFSIVTAMVVIKFCCDFINLLRPFTFMTLIFAFILSVVTFIRRKDWIIFTALTGVALLCIIILYKSDVAKFYAFYARQTVDHQYCQFVEGDFGYNVYPLEYYNSTSIIPLTTLIYSYFRGLSYALFSPFLFFGVRNIFNLFAALQTLFFCALSPFILRGLVITLRYKWKDVLPILTFSISTISAYALLEGNIGTMFRHRDSLMAFFIFFAVVGAGVSLGYIEKTLSVHEN